MPHPTDKPRTRTRPPADQRQQTSGTISQQTSTEQEQKDIKSSASQQVRNQPVPNRRPTEGPLCYQQATTTTERETGSRPRHATRDSRSRIRMTDDAEANSNDQHRANPPGTTSPPPRRQTAPLSRRPADSTPASPTSRPHTPSDKRCRMLEVLMPSPPISGHSAPQVTWCREA